MSKSMGKSLLTRKLSKKINLPLYKTKEIIDEMLMLIVELILSKGSLQLQDFGKFIIKKKKGYVINGRFSVPPRTTMVFTPSGDTKERLYYLLEPLSSNVFDDNDDVKVKKIYKKKKSK